MKNQINIRRVIMSCSFIFLLSCYSNLGNYDYVDVNTIKITNSEDSIYNVISKRDTLRIYPKIVASMYPDIDSNLDRYEFSWNIDDIKTKNLIYPVDMSAGDFYAKLEMKDKVTGLSTRAQWRVNVGDLYKKGYVILTKNENDEAQLDMISILGNDTTYLKDVSSSSGMPTLKNPRALFVGWATRNNEIHIMAENQTLKLAKSDFKYNPITGNYIDNFTSTEMFTNFNVTAIVDPKSFRVTIVDGYAYAYSSGMSPYFYEYPHSRYTKKYVPYKVANMIAANYKGADDPISNWATDRRFVMYNDDAKHFVFIKENIITMDTLSDKKGDPFSWKTGMEHVATSNSYYGDGDNFTLLKDDQGSYFLYHYVNRVNWTPSFSKIGRYDVSDAPGIERAKYLCFSANQSYVFYGSGTKLYGYDYKKNVPTFEMEMGGEVTFIFDNPHFKSGEGGKDFLYICSYGTTPSSGKIIKKHIINNPNRIGLEDPLDSQGNPMKVEWTGLNQVIDLIYKE